MRRRPLSADAGASTVLGALLVLLVLSGALVYTNAYRTPEKGAGLERAQARLLGAEMDRLAAATTSAAAGTTVTVPVSAAPPASTPSLLRGIVLDPAPPGATLAFDPTGPTLRVTHVTPGGRTVHDVGNATGGLPLGRVTATTAGHYIAPLAFTVEAGAGVHSSRGGHVLAHPPDWSWREESGVRALALTVPHLTGAAWSVTDSENHAVALVPIAARASGGPLPAATAVTIEVARTPAAAAWGAYLNETFAPATATVRTGPAGSATITLAAPAGAPLALDVRYARVGVQGT